MSKTLKPCRTPGCPNLIRSSGYCPDCLKTNQRTQSRQRRSTGTDANYGPRWAADAARYFAEHPFCRRCGGVATIRHHVVERSDGGSDDDSNLVPMCRSCHSWLHAKKRGGWNDGEGASKSLHRTDVLGARVARFFGVRDWVTYAWAIA